MENKIFWFDYKLFFIMSMESQTQSTIETRVF